MRKSIKGITIAELCICMALLAILTVTISSFCIITNNYSARISADRDVKEGLNAIDYALDVWTSAIDSENYGLTTDGETLCAVDRDDPTKRYTLTLAEDSHFRGTTPTQAIVNFELAHIHDVVFEIRESSEGTLLIVARVVYTDASVQLAMKKTAWISIKQAVRCAGRYTEG